MFRPAKQYELFSKYALISKWTPVHVMKPMIGIDSGKMDSVLSVEELSDLDGIEFLSHSDIMMHQE